ncbi:flagellin [Alteromonas oceani]|uniref:Flagellin n=1 Tax=Alteromonas oceani TaxID=2071609 RepID=A0ABV7JQS6_9ALTE|nr:flagellin [Alteromonas oceani]
MTLFVNTNTSSISARNSLFSTSNTLSLAYERLSSGLRINQAADDAAGLQISDRMTSQIEGLKVAVRNANDGISLTQTADAALSETTQNLQRLRTLVIQASNGVYSQADIAALQKEATALIGEINRNSQSTEFAGEKILNGRYESSFQVGANGGQGIGVNITNSESSTFSSIGLGIAGLDLASSRVGPVYDGSEIRDRRGSALPGNILFDTRGITAGNYNVLVSIASERKHVEVSVNLTGNDVWNGATPDADKLAEEVNRALGGSIATVENGRVVYGGADANSETPIVTAEADSNLSSINSNSNSVYTSDGREGKGALEALENALGIIGDVRASLGATQNRFQSTIRNLSNIQENMNASRSRITDADFAQETAALAKAQILQQASTTVLSQANQAPSLILSLLS